MYPYLFPELRVQTNNFGSGDEIGDELEKRLNPMKAKRVKLLSKWSGELRTNSRGEVDWEFDIPEFSGSIRIMACAYKKN